MENGLLSELEVVDYSEEKTKHRGTKDACNADLVLNVDNTEPEAEYQGEKNGTTDERSQVYFGSYNGL